MTQAGLRAGVWIAAVIVLASLGMSAAPVGAAVCSRPATFRGLASGWRQQTLGCAERLPGGSTSSWSGATSWRYRSDPNGPVGQMRPDRVLVSVILMRPRGFPAASPSLFRPLRARPLSLAAPDQIATEEGEPTIPQYRFFRRVGCQYDLDVRVDFGKREPGRALLRAAQRALDGLVLPRWVSHC